MVVCHTVVSCNGATHTFAFLSAWALFPPLPTCRSCQGRGSVPGRPGFLAPRLPKAPTRAPPVRTLVHSWGQDGAPPPVQAYGSQIYNNFTRQVSLQFKHVAYFNSVSADVLFSEHKYRREQQPSGAADRPVSTCQDWDSKSAGR